MSLEIEPSEFKAELIPLAVFLVAMGYPLLRLEPLEDNPTQFGFVFDSTPTLAESVQTFFDNSAVINVRKHHEAQKLITQKLREAKATVEESN